MEDSSFNSTDLIKNQEFFSDYDNILTCTECAGFLFNPRECTSCANLFCFDCIKSLEVNIGGNTLCPKKCKNSIFINASKNILSLLEKLIIRCYRCSSILNYNELENHVKDTCENLKFPCLNVGCYEEIAKDSLLTHHLICEYGTTQCEECGQSTIRKNLKNSLVDIKIVYEKNKEIDNLKGSLVSILKDYEILNKDNENLISTEENLKEDIKNSKLREDKLQKDYDNLKLSQDNANRIVINSNSSNNTETINYYQMIIDMLVFNENEPKLSSHGPIFDFIIGVIKQKGKFLNCKQILVFFEKLLFFHSCKKKIGEQYFQSINILIEILFTTHKELFDENLGNQVIALFYMVYSLQDNLSLVEMFKVLRLLEEGILPYIYQHISGDYFCKLMNVILSLLEHQNHNVRRYCCLIIGKLAINKKSYSMFKFEDILNALDKAINFAPDEKNKDAYELARDHGICAIGKILFFQNKYFSTSAWVSRWLAFFPLDLKFRQKYSYEILSWFLNNKDNRLTEILNGMNNENLPSIIIILVNVLETDQIFKDTNNKIRDFFEKLKEDVSLHAYIEITKQISDEKILEKLNSKFP